MNQPEPGAKVHIVMAQQGSYEDVREWVVLAFEDVRAAIKHEKMLTKAAKEIHKARKQAIKERNYEPIVNSLDEEDYSVNDAASYWVCTVELVKKETK